MAKLNKDDHKAFDVGVKIIKGIGIVIVGIITAVGGKAAHDHINKNDDESDGNDDTTE